MDTEQSVINPNVTIGKLDVELTQLLSVDRNRRSDIGEDSRGAIAAAPREDVVGLCGRSRGSDDGGDRAESKGGDDCKVLEGEHHCCVVKECGFERVCG